MLNLKTVVKVETPGGPKVGTIIGRSYWRTAFYDVMIDNVVMANVPAVNVTENLRDTFWGRLK